jgi:hypothetical protein
MFLDDALATYQVGLDREIATLLDVEALASEQRLALGRDDLTAIGGLAVRRAALMHRLADIETELAPVRAVLLANPETRRHPRFAAAEARGRQAQAVVRRLLDGDRSFLLDLETTLEERRREAHDLGAGGVGLAAYRRVAVPAMAAANLLDRRG